MARTKSQQLDAVDAAIAAIENGNQSYQILGRSFTKATINELYAERRRLERGVARESRGGIKTQRGIAL